MTIKVTTAVELTKVQRTTIEKTLSAKFKTQHPEVEYVVDPKVLGGVKLTIGSRELDGTLQARLQQVRTVLTQNI